MNDNEILPTEESVSAPTQGQANPSNRILLVDDDISIRQISAEVLTAFGYQVDTVEDGVAGWDALRASRYDLLITDHKMPKISGIELVKKLRSARVTLPVVLVSAIIPTDELTRNPSLQLAATLPKPFSAEELLRTVKKVLGAAEGAPSSTVYFPATAGAVLRPQI
jgi:DNA-binding response OmpR family regulator